MTKPNTELHNLTIAELHSGLQQKQFSSHELTEHFLQRIAQLDTELNCFISVDAERALMLADEADQRLANGDTADLLGIPIAQKDIFCTRGMRTSCGSKMLDNFIPPYDATVIARMQQAGAGSNYYGYSS